MGRVRGRVKPSAHVAKARVSPASHGISGMHPYADPHWYDNIYILHIRSGPYTRSPIPHCWLSATSAFDWHYWSRRWHQITFLFAYIRGPVWSRANLPSYLSHGPVCVCFFFFFCRLPPPISRGRRFPLGVSARGTNTIVGWQHRDCLVLHRVKTRIVWKYRGDEVVSNCRITIRAERDERVEKKLWFWYGENYAIRVIDIFVFLRKLRVKPRLGKTCFLCVDYSNDFLFCKKFNCK